MRAISKTRQDYSQFSPDCNKNRPRAPEICFHIFQRNNEASQSQDNSRKVCRVCFPLGTCDMESIKPAAEEICDSRHVWCGFPRPHSVRRQLGLCGEEEGHYCLVWATSKALYSTLLTLHYCVHLWDFKHEQSQSNICTISFFGLLSFPWSYLTCLWLYQNVYSAFSFKFWWIEALCIHAICVCL